MNTLLKNLMLGGSATALVAGASFTAAFAQANNNTSALEIEEIQSSVSRIDLKGFEQPTPVTVVGIETLNRDAKIQLGEQIRELPQVRGGTSIQSGSNGFQLSQLNAGADTISIRGLGAARNLVLFDRQRVVTSSIQDGTVDLALIPTGLVQRVDVVTGGASAAWGSDAVTGVINIVVNKTFEGFKGNVTYSNAGKVENPTYRASVAWGTSFLEGKGHIVAAADWVKSPETVFPGEVWQAYGNNGRGFVYNSAYCNAVAFPTAGATTGGTCASVSGQPLLVYAFGIGNNQAVRGGLVNSNTAGTTGSGLGATSATNNGLKGTMFIGDESTPTQFNYGTTYNTSTCYNGCTNDQYGTGGWAADKNGYHSGTYFMAASYDILPDLKASVQLNYARLTTLAYGGNQIAGTNRTIYADNPFLPREIAQRFVCNPALGQQGTATPGAACGTGTTVLSNGYNPYTQQNEIGAAGSTYNTLAQRQARPSQTLTMGFEFSGTRDTTSPSGDTSLDATRYSWNDFCNSIYQNCGFYHKTFVRGAFALDGTLGDSWTWNAYINHTATRIKENIANPLQGRFNNALDAVRVTSGNVGTSGLPIGSIQCRGLLNNALASAVPANAFGITALGELQGCVPFNPFGDGEVTNGTRNYVTPGLNPDKNPGTVNTVTAHMQQESAAFTMSGVLPWALPAGEIGAAVGAEWRLDRHGQYKIDDRSRIGGLYASGNFGQPFEGKQHAEEGFVEVQMPILKDNIVQSLNFDMAGRLTNYSNSGLVETWKLGLQSQIIDDVRFRMTWSHDIRAPTIWDLAAPGALGGRTCNSFIQGPGGSNGGNPNACFDQAGGNPTLNPERANTIAAGFIVTPTFIEGLTLSVDWYQILLKGGITTPGFQDVINRCRAGEIEAYCGSLTFTNPATGQTFGYPAGTIYPITLIQLKPVNAGQFNTAGFDMNVAYGFDLFTGQMDVSFNGNYAYDFSRTLNGIYFQGAGGGGYYSGGANFQGTLNFNYREGAWSFGTQFRIQGDSLMNLGNQGNPLIAVQGVTYTRDAAGNVIPTVGAGQRDLITGAETNYNAYQVTTDVRVQYRWNNNITLFANVDNLQNLPFGGWSSRRSYRMGVRFNY